MRTILVLLTIALLCPVPTSSAQETITLVADEWCPYNCTPMSKHEGFMLDIARRIYTAAGYAVEYRIMPWTRALHEVDQGTADGAIGTSGNEAPHFVFPVEPCGMSDNGFFTRTGSAWKWEGLASLETVRTAFVRDYDYGDHFTRFLESHRKSPMIHMGVEGDALSRNFRLLARGRVDVVVADINVGRYITKMLHLESTVELNSQENILDPVYLAFSPRLPRSRILAGLFDEGIDKLRASGELDRIMSRYGLQDWKR